MHITIFTNAKFFSSNIDSVKFTKISKIDILILANMSIGEEECPYNNPINHILKDKKIYLNVPFSKKDFAKSNGAKWDQGKKKWYYTEDLNKWDKDILNKTFD